jgi:tetratricopeptide (TPR) repeat protein
VIVLLLLFALHQPSASAEQDIQRIAMDGWLTARALAPKGGAVNLLGPVNLQLRELDKFPNFSARYAETAIRAAVSAAQEEREEMALLLQHARGLSDQMAIGATPPQWPLPIDELEGELWFEVDRFAEARDAFAKATSLKPTPNAWIGLARANDRLGDTAAACRAYKTAASTQKLPPSVELEIALYNLKCR